MAHVIPFDPRQQPVRPGDEPMPEELVLTLAQVTAAKQHQHDERMKAIAATRKDQGRSGVQVREELHDSVAAMQMAQVVMDADAVERASSLRPQFEDLPNHAKHHLLRDMAIALRSRRIVYRRLAEYKQREAIAGVLVNLLSHRLAPQEIAMVSAALSGAAQAALLGTLDGSIKVSPTEFAAATLGMLGELS